MMSLLVGAVLLFFFAVSMLAHMWLSSVEIQSEDTLEDLAFSAPVSIELLAFEPSPVEPVRAEGRPRPIVSPSGAEVAQQMPGNHLALNI